MVMNKIKVYRKGDLSLKPNVPCAKMWAVGLEKAMLTYFEIEPNTRFSEHSHEAEQITMVIKGELTFAYEGKEVTLKVGDVIAIPSNAVHSAFTGANPCKAVDAWSPVRKEYLDKRVAIREASPNDMPFIKEHIEKFRLDDEDLDHRQLVVAVAGEEIVGFGRIRPHKNVYELGSVGVIENRWGEGIGRMIVEHLVGIFPTDEIYITTDLPEYFEKVGFKRIEPGPKDLVEKIQRVCKTKWRRDAVAMLLTKLIDDRLL
ncbi:MAG: GNAT family N-acetyltransferase [Nitrospinae bacterium]|nr:GNAT family N-acetyltransferase [Nitrospinota bacterium]